jgi:rhodanese-related sulfurtransferase
MGPQGARHGTARGPGRADTTPVNAEARADGPCGRRGNRGRIKARRITNPLRRWPRHAGRRTREAAIKGIGFLGALAGALALLAAAPPLAANDELDVRIRPDMPSVTVETADGPVTIQRIQDREHELTGPFARTSRKCPPFCIQPMNPADGVATVGELELIELLQDPDAMVLDARTLEWHLEETIPGAVHMPYTEVAGRLDELGCAEAGDDAGTATSSEGAGWDCAGAKQVALFCNGLWCGQSPTAIRAMIREGFPPERIFYYRGGMQAWKILGLTTVPGGF